METPTREVGTPGLRIDYTRRRSATADRRSRTTHRSTDRGVGRRKKTLRDAPLTLEAKRQLIEQLRSGHDVNLLCELLMMNRSSFYYDAVEEVDDGVRAAIVSIAEQFPTY